MATRENLLYLKKETGTKRLFKVKYFLDQTNNEGKWRTWKNLDHREDNPLKSKAKALLIILEQRKILVIGGHDQLRWGNNNVVTFNLKEQKMHTP